MPRRISIVSLHLLVFGTLSLLGQSDRGSISGTITDSTGAVVPGAKVIVTNPATNATLNTISSESGDYTAPNLTVGVYSVRVEREGFKPAVLNRLNVNAGLIARGDISLEVGAAQQVVEVQAQAAALQTEDAKAATTITNKLVDDLPLVVGGALRSPFDLATLTPEAKNFGDNNFVLGGGQSASYGTNLDGVSANTTRALTASWVAVNTPSV